MTTSQEIKLSELIAPHFYSVHRDIWEHVYDEYTLPGGRGSTKSSFVGIQVVLLIKQNPKAHALVLRKYGNTLKDSVYGQIMWAIDALGVSNEFHATISPM